MPNHSFERLFPGLQTTENSASLFTPRQHSEGEEMRAGGSKQDQVRQKKSRNRVLMVGNHRELTLYRAEVLRHAGFQVQTPEDKKQAIVIIERGDFDVAALSYTLSNNTVQELADRIREHCPHCPVVAIAETHRVDRRIAPDAIALVADGPSGLVSALQKVLQQN